MVAIQGRGGTISCAPLPYASPESWPRAPPPLTTLPPPDPAALVAEHSYAFAFADAFTPGALTGPGAEFLRAQTSPPRSSCCSARSTWTTRSRSSPARCTRCCTPSAASGTSSSSRIRWRCRRRSRRPRAAKWTRSRLISKRYPTLFEFDSDEDLTLLANVGKLEDSADAIWGVEQATGAMRYLEELVELAPDATAHTQAQAMLEAARVADKAPKYNVHWLIRPGTPDAIAALTTAFHAAPSARAAQLLAWLAKSSEIFGYYVRAEAGEYVGLYNNTVRETQIKANFLARYRAASAHETLPKAMFKFGSNHLYHGKNLDPGLPDRQPRARARHRERQRSLWPVHQPLGAGLRRLQGLPGMDAPAAARDRARRADAHRPARRCVRISACSASRLRPPTSGSCSRYSTATTPACCCRDRAWRHARSAAGKAIDARLRGTGWGSLCVCAPLTDSSPTPAGRSCRR